MKEITTILVGIDYSENSENALREASRIANWNKAKLICLHIIEEDIINTFRSEAEAFDETGVLDAAQRRLESFIASIVGAGHDIESGVKAGHPFKEILDAIGSSGAQLLVLGSHGLKKQNPCRVGTLASRCVRKAPVEVLLVRNRQRGPFRSIVACIDFSENSIAAAHRAASIALQDKASLELLHIFPSPIYPGADSSGFGPLLPPIDTTCILKSLREKLEQLASEIGPSCDGCEIRTSVEERLSVAGGIEERLQAVDADLVVLGTRGRTGLTGLLLGTTAEHLIQDAPCSALTVKPKGFSYSVS